MSRTGSMMMLSLVPEAQNEVPSLVPRGHRAHVHVAMTMMSHTNKKPTMKSPSRRLEGTDTPQHIHTSLTNRLLVLKGLVFAG